MARTPSGHAMGGGTTVQSVKIRKEWDDFLEHERMMSELHQNSRIWTDEENAFLMKARDIGITWDKICDKIGCAHDTARKQWRKLKTK